MRQPPDVALSHYHQRVELADAAGAATASLWQQVDLADITGSWTAQLPDAFLTVSGAQYAAANQADAYLTDVLASDGLAAESAAIIDPAGFAGTASDGRGLIGLLWQPVISTLLAIKHGADPRMALATGHSTLDMITRTQVADAGRAADQAALTARREVDGYVRIAVGNSCSRCLILAGKFYRWSSGFPRHPRCLPAGVVVSGPSRLASTRRWYEGELAVITTASGQQLPITGNHPVLTDRGWRPANLVQEGDYVVRGTLAEGAQPLVVPNERQVPARVEDLWRSHGVAALLKMPTTPEDFHGDGGHGEVDVVLADSLLRHGFETALAQQGMHSALAVRGELALGLDSQRAGHQKLVGLSRPTNGVVGGNGLRGALSLRHLAGAHKSGRRCATDADTGVFDALANDVSTHAETYAQAVLALASQVSVNDPLDGQDQVPPRWDAPAVPLTVQSRAAYAQIGVDLLFRLSGQIALDRVVENRRVEWKGHVYNLTSGEGWYSANGLIVSNCDCVHMPSRQTKAAGINQDPRKIYNSLTAKERTAAGWSKADQQALDEGADIYQVTNARAGMYTAGGRSLTHVGTSRHGTFGARPRGAPIRGPRLTPDQIFADAKDDRDEAVRLLRSNGYLLEPAKVAQSPIAMPAVAAELDPALKMTIKQLKQLAKDANVPLFGRTKKADIVRALRDRESVYKVKIPGLPEWKPPRIGATVETIEAPPLAKPALGGPVLTGASLNNWADYFKYDLQNGRHQFVDAAGNTPAEGIRVHDLRVSVQSSGDYVAANGTAWRFDGVAYLVEHGPEDFGSPWVSRSLDDLRAAHSEIPGAARANLSYTTVTGANPADAYWKVKYNNPGHVSAMTAGGGHVTMYHFNAPYSRVNTGMLRHETGHNLDDLLGRKTHGSESPDWSAAAKADVKASAKVTDLSDEFEHGAFGKVEPGRGFPEGVTSYGRSSAGEDFAESMQLYQHGVIAQGRLKAGAEVGPIFFRDLYPARAKILDKQFPAIAKAQKAEIKALRTPKPPEKPAAATVAGDLSKLKVPELRALAKERGLTGYSKQTKPQLLERLGKPETVPAIKLVPPKPAVRAVRGAAILDVPSGRMTVKTRSTIPADVLAKVPQSQRVLYVREIVDMQWRGGLPQGWTAAKARGYARTLAQYTNEEGPASPWSIRKGGAASRRAADRIGEILATSTTKADIEAWRGLDSPHSLFGNALNGPLVGARVRDPSFMSVSGSRDVSATYANQHGVEKGLLMRMHIPAGTRAITVNNPDEVELLIDRGYTLTVTRDSGPGSVPRIIDVTLS